MFCFISLWLSLIPLSPHAQPPYHPTDELTECVSCCFLWRLVQDLHPMELSSCQKSGAERADGCLQQGSAWCQSPTSQDRRSSFLSNNTQTAFFPSSFSSLCEFTRQSDAFARSARSCTSHPGQCLPNPPISRRPELQLGWHTLALLWELLLALL